MVFLKALTVLIAGILSILAVRHMMREVEAVKVRAEARRRPPGPPSRIRLRQDPRTGIYYPEG